MKPLYYLEFAVSRDMNYNNIPASEIKWFPSQNHIAWTEYEEAMQERLELIKNARHFIVRVKKASWWMNLRIRLAKGWLIK